MSNAPELYLIFETGPGVDADAAERLSTLLAAQPVSSLLLRPAPGSALDAGTAKPLAALAQKRGVAVLIDGDAALARLIKADGVHLPWSKDPLKVYREARETIGAHAMIGADAGRSRDDAMALGEDGADYIAFGIPAHVEDRATAEARQCDLINWWSEIFEVPCVAFDVATPEHAAALADAGADFVTVAVTPDLTTRDATARAKTFATALAVAEAPA